MKNIKKNFSLVLFGIGFLGSLSAQAVDDKAVKPLADEVSQEKLRYVVKDLGHGGQKHSLVTDKDFPVCALVTMQDPCLTMMYDSQLCIDSSKLPKLLSYLAETLLPTHLIVGNAIKKKHNLDNLNNVAFIFNFYVLPDYRGKGCAHRLLEEVCINLFAKEVNVVALIPAPFEIENGAVRELKDEETKKRLVKLYRQCGFKYNDESNLLFMSRDKINN